MILTRNMTFRALKVSNLETFRALKLQSGDRNYINKMRTRQEKTLNNRDRTEMRIIIIWSGRVPNCMGFWKWKNLRNNWESQFNIPAIWWILQAMTISTNINGRRKMGTKIGKSVTNLKFRAISRIIYASCEVTNWEVSACLQVIQYVF